MINLLSETRDEIRKWVAQEPEACVRWVGVRDGSLAMTWEDFETRANRYYDNGFGSHEVVLSLVVVGEDWWLERHEYDGAEWWEFKRQPVLKKANLKPFDIIFMWPREDSDYEKQRALEDLDPYSRY